METLNIQPNKIAKLYLSFATEDGDLITPLKMQKLVYYAYCWVIAKHGKRLFKEAIEAWPNGPVIKSLYGELKEYGSMPIGDDYLPLDPGKLMNDIPKEILEMLREVYEQYVVRSAFELVASTHSELPWTNARRGLNPTASSNNKLKDEDILAQFSTN